MDRDTFINWIENRLVNKHGFDIKINQTKSPKYCKYLYNAMLAYDEHDCYDYMITLNGYADDSNNTLEDIQQHFSDVCAERGWDKDDVLVTWLLFTEEVGELSKAIRNSKSLYTESNKNISDNRENLEGEFADVFMDLLHLANTMGINLQDVYWKKHYINKNRKWN